MKLLTNEVKKFETKGWVYCPICTHTVEAIVTQERKATYVQPGQKCPRCSASLDAGYVMRLTQAA
jgi:uncharacterized Zn finger protein (UPF0148 family)